MSRTPQKKKATLSQVKVFISYRSQDPDMSLAQEFHHGLEEAGYSTFMAGESIRLGEDWAKRIDAELLQCDYFLLLLSERSSVSEMVTEEVRRAKQLHDQTGKPTILPIRLNFPISAPLNYDLRGYQQRIQQRQWQTVEDTAEILAEILALLSEGKVEQPLDPLEELYSPTIAEEFAQQESVQMPPLPVAEPELPGGQVDLASRFYVERGKIEAQCYEAIVTPGALIRIKAPRQMGKTSLMARILRYAEQQGCLGVPLSFQVADSVVFGDLDQFLRWFAASVGRRLKVPNRLNEYWDEVFGSKDNCTAYFEEYLLPALDQPLALCLDEVDMVFQHLSIASDFFGLLRNWHEMGKSSDLWKRFRLVVVHSTEVYIPMNINQSPFNVGLPIELLEFTADQVQDLARRHGLNWNTSQIGRLMGMVGGHPYLVRLALYHVKRENTTLETLLRNAPTESGLYGDHLRRHLWNLEQHPELAAAVRQLVATEGTVRLPSVQGFQLHSMGLVDLLGNDVQFRSELYRAYFRDRLRSA
ncbi:MAG: AAA-like domain-containing protein [Leptolyngbya sp. Prado105]|jgi:serine/threonine-protein kinase|nr:AAA-like domain-containing protein [Leptolyngbya sp. Prado105]